MYFPAPLLLLALSAGALALPTNQTSALKARARGAASIAAFDAPDCTGPPHGPRPQDNDNGCIPFTGATNNIGINWGSSFGLGRATQLLVYKDNSCKVYASSPIMPSHYDDSKGTNACVSMSSFGGPWRSVKYCYNEKGCV